MIRNDLKKWLGDTLDIAPDEISLEYPDNFEHGDYSTNIALVLAGEREEKPKALAESLATKLSASQLPEIKKIEVAGAGFINFFLTDEAIAGEVSRIKNSPARSSPARSDLAEGREGKKINVEFVSANPTGPLTMANGRGGFYGDALANILKEAGHAVTREFYINDAGNQIRLLQESIEAAEGKRESREEYYKGRYISELKDKSGEEAVEILLERIKKSLEKAGINFDVWFSEKKLREDGELEKTLKSLEEKKLTEKKDGAVWLGDAVLIKSDGEPTYFLSDLAYHYDKFVKRKFDTAIDIWGADHHGYVERMKRGVEALGIEPERLKIIIMQLVRLISGGKEVRMSKRTGEFVTMDELLEEVGVDVAHWFFLERSPNTHVNFDLDLAKERSEKNPVFYVQYAHARMCSIIEKAKGLGEDNTEVITLIKEPSVRALLVKLMQFESVLEQTAKDFQVHRLTAYAYELAEAFSAFYRDVRIINDDSLNRGGSEILAVTKLVLAKTLSLLGISAPSKM